MHNVFTNEHFVMGFFTWEDELDGDFCISDKNPKPNKYQHEKQYFHILRLNAGDIRRVAYDIEYLNSLSVDVQLKLYSLEQKL